MRVSLLELDLKRNYDEISETNVSFTGFIGSRSVSDLELDLQETGIDFREICSKCYVFAF